MNMADSRMADSGGAGSRMADRETAHRDERLAMPENRVVQVRDLTVRFTSSERTVEAVRDLSFHVDRGETLAIVGESGSGKSVTSLAIMRLVEFGGGRIVQGSMTFHRPDGSRVDLAKA